MNGVHFIILFQRNTVYLWLERWQFEGNLNCHVTTGRPRCTNVNQDRLIVERARADRFVNTTQIAAQIQISNSTVRRRLNESGLKHRIPAKKPFLTQRHKDIRLAFAARYLNYDFNKVCFMDEKVFCSSDNGRVSLWRVDNSRYHERNILLNERSGRITNAYWGWMSKNSLGELVEISGRMNSMQYKSILEDSFLPTAQVVYPGEHITFIQDNSSIHNSHIVQNWINDQQRRGVLTLIKLPPKSPDLNPIENLWGKMVQQWDTSQARTRENLKRHVYNIWDSFRGKNVCENLVGSMRQRLQDVLNAEGGYTRY